MIKICALFCSLIVVTGCADSDWATFENAESTINSTRISASMSADKIKSQHQKLERVATQLEGIANDTGRSFKIRAQAVRLYVSALVKKAGIDFPELIAELVYGEGDILKKFTAATANIDISTMSSLLRGANKVAEFLERLTTPAEREANPIIVRDLQFQRGFVHLLKSVFIGTNLSVSTAVEDKENFVADCKAGSTVNLNTQISNYVADANIALIIFREQLELKADNPFSDAAEQLVNIAGSAYIAPLNAALVARQDYTQPTEQLDPDGKGAAVVSDVTALDSLCDSIYDAGQQSAE